MRKISLANYKIESLMDTLQISNSILSLLRFGQERIELGVSDVPRYSDSDFLKLSSNKITNIVVVAGNIQNIYRPEGPFLNFESILTDQFILTAYHCIAETISQINNFQAFFGISTKQEALYLESYDHEIYYSSIRKASLVPIQPIIQADIIWAISCDVVFDLDKNKPPKNHYLPSRC